MTIKFLFASLLVMISAGGVLAQPAIVPDKVITLFNGKDLSHFFTWDVAHGRANTDRVFTAVEQVDGAPAIRISGQHFGGIITHARYANYRFVAEFRWGLLTWQPRRDKTRDGGILFHCQGEPGNNTPDFRGPYMHSVEYQIIEGGTGDLILVRGHYPDQPKPVCPTLYTTIVPNTRRWDPKGTPVQLMEGRHRTDWLNKDPEWKDVLGFRGRNDVEKPVGQWNQIEAICDGGSVTYFLNGVKVNEGRDGNLREGRILIQSEGAEMFFRNLELRPLRK